MMDLTHRNITTMLGGLVLALATTQLYAQMEMPAAGKAPLSPPAQASVTLKGQNITIAYSAPSMRSRPIFGTLVPYNKVWRTGANAATTLKTPINLKIGTLSVPAGTYTLYSLPTEHGSTLIVNKQTGQWGTVYDETKDLGRVKMTNTSVADPVETFVIKFDKPEGDTATLNFVWEKTSSSVKIKAE